MSSNLRLQTLVMTASYKTFVVIDQNYGCNLTIHASGYPTTNQFCNTGKGVTENNMQINGFSSTALCIARLYLHYNTVEAVALLQIARFDTRLRHSSPTKKKQQHNKEE